MSIFPKGMQKDASVSIFPNDSAFDIQNMRITSSDNNGMLSLTNEKGNTEINWNLISPLILDGTIVDTATIGVQKIGKFVILFSIITIEKNLVRDNYDVIIRAELNDNNDAFNIIILYKGKSLGFKLEYPIESIGIFENNDIQKVYWVDGIHQLRVINITPKDERSNANDSLYSEDRTFDIIPKVKTPKVDVDTLLYGGDFPSGIIQHAISYYRKNGEESSLVWVSPIRYLSNKNGISPDNKSTNTFIVKVKENIDTSFDYIRLYSIVRTSINDVPTVKVVKDINIENIFEVTKENPLVIEDNGFEGYPVSSTYLLFLNNYIIYPSTLVSKDNTLFLGNLFIPNTKIEISESELENVSSNIVVYYKEENNQEGIEYNDINSLSYEGLLNHSAKKITTFKWGEQYRLGLQGKKLDGTLSEVIYIGDKLQNKHPNVENNKLKLPYFSVSIPSSIISKFKEKGYKEVRLVMAERNSTNKRRILCQGIVSPTVFRLEDRIENGPYSQSSWILRPAGHHGESLSLNDSTNGELQFLDNNDSYFVEEDDLITNVRLITVNYRFTYVRLNFENHITLSFTITTNDKEQYYDEVTSSPYVSVNEQIFKSLYNSIVKKLKKHIPEDQYYKIPSYEVWTGLDSIGNHNNVNSSFTYEETSYNENFLNKKLKQSNNYYIDDSIITFNSPDIENVISSIDDHTKLRIIGIISDIQHISNYTIEGSNLKSTDSLGEIHRSFQSLKSNLLWNDTYEGRENNENWLFATYMWHRKGSLNADDRSTTDNKRTSELKTKIFLNCNFSKSTINLSDKDIWENNPAKIKLFNQDFISALSLPGIKYNNHFNEFIYYGNIDTIIIPKINKDYKGYNIYGKEIKIGQSIDTFNRDFIKYSKVKDRSNEDVVGKDPISIKYKSTPHIVIKLGNNKSGNQSLLPARIPYSNSGAAFWEIPKSGITIVNFITESINTEEVKNAKEGNIWIAKDYGFLQQCTSNSTGNNPTWVSISNKPSIVLFNNNLYELVYNKIDELESSIEVKENINKISRDIISDSLGYNDLYYIAELYKEELPYKTHTKEELETETWIPIGAFTNIEKSNIVTGERGDTFYQRWDCLKTYPFSKEDTNQVIDITSFMVESHINIDGRYDRRRYTDLTIDNSNFNKINPIYSQSDNYFNYHIIDSSSDKFPNQVLWSSTKSLGEKIDSWTNLTASNAIDLDGDKGEIRSLNRLNNEIYAFQDTAISRILFNSRAAINTSDGIPIELSNGGKVEGKYYLTDKYGCINKWSIAESPAGLYFTDSNIKTICLFNGQNIIDLANSKGMYSWVKDNLDSSIWNPAIFKDSLQDKVIRTHYDITTNDVYFINSQTALAYNEKLGAFSGFFSYERVPWMFEFKGNSYQLRDKKLWKLHSGNYCSFFGNSPSSFSIEFIANQEFSLDKTFESIEFRDSDIYNNNEYHPFDFIKVENEYQKGINFSDSLKKKFRTWRWQFPRNNQDKIISDRRNRIRNPWAKITLLNTNSSDKKISIYDTLVTYYV